MAFKDTVQGLLDKVKTRRADEQPQLMSNRPNGGFSGYQPRMPRSKPAENAAPEHPATGFSGMMPGGVDASVMRQFQQVGGQTGQMAPQPMAPQGQPMQAQAMPQGQPVQGQPMQPPQPHARQPRAQQMAQGMPQRPAQPMQNTGYQSFRPNPAPQMMQTGWQNAYPPQSAQPPQQPQQTGWQGAAQPRQAAQPVQEPQSVDNGLRYFPGSYVDTDGSVYKMVMRVTQITGVASCYRLIEFMQNNEAIIVNAEQIADVMEADRCMDLLFGAAYAMNQNFVRISGKMIYLIAPRQMQVIPFDGMLNMSDEDINRRWPGSNRGYTDGRFAAGQGRQEDFAPAYGQRASRNAAAGAYTDYGGFGSRRR